MSTVPAEAQQALLFLAPETGGDFNTLRNAVRGRPGSFVRAAQDLQAASWERMRLEAYLADVKVTSQFDPAALKTRTEMAARSLGIKINESCFLKPADQQASCLSQNSEGMVLDDANAQSLVNQLASGSTLDLMNQLSYSTMAGGGAYSPYIGAIVDTAKILSSLHTAHFQYIPALALPTADSLNLRLNMPPSFRNPKSVVVVALPPIGPAAAGTSASREPQRQFLRAEAGSGAAGRGSAAGFRHATGSRPVSCTWRPADDAKGRGLDIPLMPDAARGGLVPRSANPSRCPAGELNGVVRGKWGFDDWEGPQYHLVSAQPGKWTLAAVRPDLPWLWAATTPSTSTAKAQFASRRSKRRRVRTAPVPLAWKSPKPDALEVTVPLKDAEPGPVEHRCLPVSDWPSRTGSRWWPTQRLHRWTA